MTVGIAGLWERGYIAPVQEAELWRFPLRDFRVDFLAMAPVSGIDVAGDLREFPNMETILDEYRETLPLVFVDEHAPADLDDFRHPADALYIFGRVGSSPSNEFARPNDYGIRIPTPAGAGLLWPHQAAAVVLYHRSKQWP